jgi:hypothetical protein
VGPAIDTAAAGRSLREIRDASGTPVGRIDCSGLAWLQAQQPGEPAAGDLTGDVFTIDPATNAPAAGDGLADAIGQRAREIERAVALLRATDAGNVITLVTQGTAGAAAVAAVTSPALAGRVGALVTVGATDGACGSADAANGNPTLPAAAMKRTLIASYGAQGTACANDAAGSTATVGEPSLVRMLTTDRPVAAQGGDIANILCAIDRQCLVVTAGAGAEVTVIAPDGRRLSRRVVEIPGGAFALPPGGGSAESVLVLPHAASGTYRIIVGAARGSAAGESLRVEAAIDGRAVALASEGDADPTGTATLRLVVP